MIYEELDRCKFCKTIPVLASFGKSWEIYCPSDSRKCPYPPCIEGADPKQLAEQWNHQFGDKGEFE